MKKILITILCCLIMLPAFATAWVQIDGTKYIDKDSIKYYKKDNGEYDFTKKSFWMKQINDGESEYFKNVSKVYKSNIEYVRTRWIIDTRRNKHTVKSSIYYDKNGNVINSYTIKDCYLEWDDVVPETTGELWFKLVKNKRLLNKIYKNQPPQYN